jgi:hypothetical protein
MYRKVARWILKHLVWDTTGTEREGACCSEEDIEVTRRGSLNLAHEDMPQALSCQRVLPSRPA